ncbi:MAG: glycosyltransferase [Myxococcota bacterium]|nr:glycosyltransferase [Myxococcota bacterium]
MKILVLSNLYPPDILGGYEILCEQVVDRLRARGHQVEVLSTRNPQRTGPEQAQVHRLLQLYTPFSEKAGLQRHRRLRADLHNARQVRAFLRGRDFDLAFVWSQLRLGIGALRALQDSGLPTALTLNDEHLASYLPISFKTDADWGLASLAFKFPLACKPQARRLASWTLDRSIFAQNTLQGISLDHVTCISHRLKADLLARGLPIPNAKVIHQGIPIERFDPKDEPGALGVPAKVLYVGQLHHYKGVHILIDAMHRVAQQYPEQPPRLSIAGGGPEEYLAELHRRADEGPAQIDFLGKLPHAQLPALYREHDIFVFPSSWAEPFGLTHLEAMACGTPVISTADGGHGELVVDGQNSLVFPKEDAVTLAAHLQRLIEHPKLAKGLAERALEQVRREYSMERYVSDLELFLAEVKAAAPAKPPRASWRQLLDSRKRVRTRGKA